MIYHGFISYSHAADGRLAPALQRALHRLARPVFKLRALRVFRDKESLSANPALWSAIEQALGRTAYFILLASPESSKSPWVLREIEWWKSHRSVANQLIVLTDGEIVWDPVRGDFDWDRTTALPRSLGGRFPEEPLWVDLRWARTTEDLSLRNTSFRAAVLALAAPLHGKPKDELDGEDVRQYRKTRQLARSAVALLTTLTLVAIALAVYAVRQRDEAVQQRERALSRQAGSQALRVLETRFDTGLLLAVEASRRAGTFDARNALFSALDHQPRLVAFLQGNRTAVTATAFSPDGRTLVSGTSDDGVVRFWDTTRLAALGDPVVAHGQGVTRLAFGPDGRLLASAGRDGTVQLWDVATRRPVGSPLVAGADTVSRLAFGPDGRVLAAGDVRGAVSLWNVATHSPLGPPLTGRLRDVTALAFDETGQQLAAGSSDGTVVKWDLRTPERGATASFDSRMYLVDVAFAADGRVVATGLSGAKVVRWEVDRAPPETAGLASGMTTNIVVLDERATAVASASRTIAVADANGTVYVADLAAPLEAKLLSEKATIRDFRPSSGILSVALDSGGRRMATGYRDGTLALWNLTDPHHLARPFAERHRREITALDFAPDGSTLVSVSLDQTVMLWDTGTLEALGPAIGGAGKGWTGLDVGRSGRWMATVEDGGGVLLWDMALRKPIGPALAGHGGKRVNAVVFSPDDTRIVTAGQDDRLVWWDVRTGRPDGTPIVADQRGVASVAYSPDGRTLVSGGVDGTVVLWEVVGRRAPGPRVSAHRERVNVVRFSPDGQTVASAGRDARLHLFRVDRDQSLQPLRTLEPIDREQRQSIGGALVFGPDGKTLVSGGNGRIVLWDLDSGQPLQPVLYSWGPITGAGTRLAISPDGTTLAASCGDGIVLWEIGLSRWQQRACRLVGRDLTREEWDQFMGAELPYRRTCSELVESGEAGGRSGIGP